MVPFALPPTTAQVTLALVVFATAAVNCCVSPAFTLAVAGLTVTLIAGLTVTVAEAAALVSACEVAVTVTVPEGGVEGAVYRPLLEIAPPPLTVQVTAVLLVLATAAVNCTVRPAFTVAVAGLTVTVTAGGGGLLFPPPPPPHADKRSVAARAAARTGQSRSRIYAVWGE